MFRTVVVAAVIAAAPGRADELRGLDRLDFRSVVREAKTRVFPAVVFIKVVREDNERGEKRSRKQMAYVGAVYRIAPLVRTAEEIVDDLRRKERQAARPQPQNTTNDFAIRNFQFSFSDY